MSVDGGYSQLVQRLFAAPAHAGALPPGPGKSLVAEAVALEQGAWLRLELRIEGERVSAARFRAWGCPHFIAACELAAAALEGLSPAQAAGLEPGVLARQLDAPPGKLGSLLLIQDALRDLAAASSASQ